MILDLIHLLIHSLKFGTLFGVALLNFCGINFMSSDSSRAAVRLQHRSPLTHPSLVLAIQIGPYAWGTGVRLGSAHTPLFRLSPTLLRELGVCP